MLSDDGNSVALNGPTPLERPPKTRGRVWQRCPGKGGPRKMHERICEVF